MGPEPSRPVDERGGTGGFDVLEQLGDSLDEHRMDEIGGKVGEGDKHKGPLMQVRVWNDKPGRPEEEVVVEKDVDVDQTAPSGSWARGPARFQGA